MEETATKIEWLQGIKVLLLGHYVPAPMAAYLLHNLGAEVIKVEDGQGDHLRQIGSFSARSAGKTSPMFHALNAGFKSLGLQYRKPQGAAILAKLMQQVDVVIDGNRVGAMERYLGASLATVAPHIIYVPISAYGQVGPMAKLAGHDNNILALAGNLSYTQTNADGKPTIFSAPVADIFAGQMAALGALAAIIGRKGVSSVAKLPQTIDASMLHAGFFLNFLELAARNDPQHHVPQAGQEWMNGGRPDYSSYRCSDGKFVFFGLIEGWAAKRFFTELGREDLAAYLADPEVLAHELEEMFLTRTQASWVDIGTRHDACITPVHDLEQAVADPQIVALGRMQQVNDLHLGTISVPSFPLGFGKSSQSALADPSAPLLGEHNAEILGQMLHLSATEIDGLYEEGVLAQTTWEGSSR